MQELEISSASPTKNLYPEIDQVSIMLPESKEIFTMSTAGRDIFGETHIAMPEIPGPEHRG
jgi:hypothetical protein